MLRNLLASLCHFRVTTSSSSNPSDKLSEANPFARPAPQQVDQLKGQLQRLKKKIHKGSQRFKSEEKVQQLLAKPDQQRMFERAEELKRNADEVNKVVDETLKRPPFPTPE